jgi:hypothetical protein
MSPRIQHFLLYLAFVGIPLFGLVGVLRLGRDLPSPPSVGGRWKLDSGGRLASALACAPTQDEDPIVLRIGQSGPHLRMDLRDTDNFLLRGKLEGTNVSADAAGPRSQPPAVRLRAQVEPGSQPPVLVGTLDVTRCPSQVPFRAVREKTSGGTF